MDYPGTLEPVDGSGIKRLPFCFTGADARSMAKYMIVIGSSIGVFVGMAICLLILSVFGFERLARLIGLAVGAVGGLLIGLFITVPAIHEGICTCPPERFGFCINVIFMKIPGVARKLPWPPFIEPARAQCARLVPPGCP